LCCGFAACANRASAGESLRPGSPKRQGLPDEYANDQDENGEGLVVPDVVIHRRGPEGLNILVLEVKKTTNPAPRHCDSSRIHAFCPQYG
jgi:hypothetical protein